MIKNRPYIIAEIGINHDGSLKKIFSLIKLAKKAGVNAVKFQLYQSKTLANKHNKKKYKLFVNKKKENLYKMWERLRIKKNWLKKIEIVCKKSNINLGFSVFDETSLEYLNNIKYNFLKVASSDINDHYLIKKIIKKKKKIIVSTGMANLLEIKKTCNILKKSKFSLLHCVSIYPTKIQNINLKRMLMLKKYTKNVGFSDHTRGITASLMAINLGAKVIEKHFTYNKNADGPDHAGSANFKDMKEICEFAKYKNKIFGTGKINPSIEEKKMKAFARKSIYAKQNIKVGEIFSIKNIEKRRPGNGLDASKYEMILGKKNNFFQKKGNTIKF